MSASIWDIQCFKVINLWFEFCVLLSDSAGNIPQVLFDFFKFKNLQWSMMSSYLHCFWGWQEIFFFWMKCSWVLSVQFKINWVSVRGFKGRIFFVFVTAECLFSCRFRGCIICQTWVKGTTTLPWLRKLSDWREEAN